MSSKLHSILHSQRQTLHLFLSNPPTRTPVVVLYVASFGGALHAAVTTYYYLAIGATTMDIGQLGFIMSVGALIGSPLSGLALDRYGPWIPISVTAGACAWGCLWRGVAKSLASLRMGAILLGVGVNMWTVVLGHLVKSFPASMRSEVLSGFGVQFTVIQLIGKGVFPLVEYGLHHIVGLEDALFRYRIHMGTCTFFCFYGTFALFWDRKNVKLGKNEGIAAVAAATKYQQKHSDVVDGLEMDSVLPDRSQQSTTPTLESSSTEAELANASNKSGSKYAQLMSDEHSGESFADNSSNTSSASSYLKEPEPSDHETISKLNTNEETSNTQQNKQFITTVTLTFALLLQSIATTILTILWPLLAHDRFDLSAHTFGVLTFISSAVSTGAVAAFPIIERSEKIGGRVRCAAWGFGLASILCVVFCFCSFGDYWGGGVDMEIIGLETDGQVDNGIDGILEQQHDVIQQQLQSRKQLGLHALSAMAFQAALCFLEPSLKSILSLVVNSSSSASSKGSTLGGTIGFMQTLGSVGGMIGNLAGTWMYKLSKDDLTKGSRIVFQGGSLPFVVTALLMAISSILIWRLEEPTHFMTSNSKSKEDREYKSVRNTDVESGYTKGNEGDDISAESVEHSEEEIPDGCCLALRETTYDLKLD